MSKCVFTQIPEGFTIEVFGPVEGFWSCELSNEDGTVKLRGYGLSAQGAVELCLTKLPKPRASRVASLPTTLPENRLNILKAAFQGVDLSSE